MRAEATISARRAVLTVLAASLALSSAYLLVLLCAAAAAHRRRDDEEGPPRLRFAVVVPAHNEEAVIADTLASLGALDHADYDLIVVADNCSDRTATVARSAGATVWEREDSAARGKGYALAWAIERLAAERPDVEAVAVVDADCRASPNLLRALERGLADGAGAVQADYRVANPNAGAAAALRYAAFALVNTVRPLGKSRLGLSAGLLGTGMAFTTDVLERVPWASHGLAEDLEQHLRLVDAGVPVSFAPEASVASPMPTADAAAHEQQLRWESGKWHAIREWTPRVLASGLARRDPVRIHAALDPIVPPQSLHAAATLAVGALAAVTRARAAFVLAAAAAAGQAGFVLGGLAVAGAPPSVYRGLLGAPRLVAQKLRVYRRVAAGGPDAWVRTEREK